MTDTVQTVNQPDGAQVLPWADENSTISPWVAHCAADADQRNRFPRIREEAGRLFIHTGEGR